MALLPALLAWLCWRVAADSAWVLVAFPVAAVLEEWLRGHLFSGLPWTAMGNLLLGTPAIGWASWFGVYGVALLPVLAAATVLLLAIRQWRVGIAGAGVLLLLVWMAPAPFEGEGERYQATLVQANIPQDRKWDHDFINETMQRYTSRSAAGAEGSDVIIWPEAAVPFFLERAPGWDHWLDVQIKAWQTPLLFGGLKLTGSHTAQNGLIAVDPAVSERQFAGKQHLVPFGEYVPAWIPFLHTLVPEIADFRPAEDRGVVTVRGLQYGALICYESLFPEQARARVRNGAEVLVNITNDAWYGTTPAAWQHFQAARMRAVETGRYVLRAANTGVTAVIAPNGEVEVTLPWWREDTLTASFQRSSRQTPYVRWGEWPLLACVVILVGVWVRRKRYE